MMRKGAEEILKEALQLSESERARVAADLLTSLGPDIETHGGDAWIAEVERRARAAIDGIPGLTWYETRTRVERTRTKTRTNCTIEQQKHRRPLTAAFRAFR